MSEFDPSIVGEFGYSDSWSSTNPNNDLTYRWMQEANAFNAREAEKLRKWQKMMSDTAYQRAMKDMLKAGLNPILAGNLGGASTPSGAAGSANFTAAGATSSSGSHSYSQRQSIEEAVANIATREVNSAVQSATGGTVRDLVKDVAENGSRRINRLVSDVRDHIQGVNTKSARDNNIYYDDGFQGGSRNGTYTKTHKEKVQSSSREKWHNKKNKSTWKFKNFNNARDS